MFAFINYIWKFWVLNYYGNDPAFSDIWVNATNTDAGQTAQIVVFTVCHSIYIIWMHLSMVKPLC